MSTLMNRVEDHVITLTTVDEGLVKTLVTTSDYTVMDHLDDTKDPCDDMALTVNDSNNIILSGALNKF